MRLITVLLFLLTLSAPALADKRVALVIGNSAYKHVPQLTNPRNDATDMAAKLEALGFEVVQGEDLDLAGIRNTIREFVSKLEGADISLFFYAGHGLQVNGNNYMAPVDAQLASYDDLDFEALPMDLVLSAMERNTKVNLIFLDACRDNPLAQNLARSMGTRSTAIGRGLAKIGSGVGSLIAFSTQPGNVALDGDGRNSPFTAALLKHLGTPGQDITRDLVYVRRDVLDATGGKQVPWDNSSLTGEVVLAPKAGVTQAKQEPATESKPQASSDEESQFEITFWNSINDKNSKAFFLSYLARYPSGRFVDIAKLSIAEIDARAEDARKAQALARAQEDQKRAEANNAAAAERAAQLKSAEEAARRAEEARLAAEAARKALEQRLADLEALQKRRETELAATRLNQDNPIEVARLEQPGDSEATVRSIDPVELVRATQKELARIGCLSGRVDGKWGSGSQGALKDYAGRQGIRLASLEPSVEILDRLKATSVRVCPLVCGRGMEEKGGRCEKAKKEASLEPRQPPKDPSERSNSARIPPLSKETRFSNMCYKCRQSDNGTNYKKCFESEAKFWEWNGRAGDICRKL